MKRRIAIVLLSIGTIAGYTAGFRSLFGGGCHGRWRHQTHHAAPAQPCQSHSHGQGYGWGHGPSE